MRWFVFVVAALALAPSAFAADLEILPGALPVGPATFTRWSGFYFGGDVGYGDANTDFSQATAPLIAYSLRELALETQDSVSTWQVLGKASSSMSAVGGFVGYNTQWQDLILGLEGDFTHSPFTATSASSPLFIQTTAGGNAYNVGVSAGGSLHFDDYAELRARAGWVLGSFMPYGFAGAAIGWSDYSVTSLVQGQQNSASPAYFPCNPGLPSCIDFSYANSAGKSSALMYGFTVGGGLDVALTPNIFLRGEVEFVQFAPLADILVSMVSARIGAGIKF